MRIDPKERVLALAYLSAYLRYKKWYIRFMYEFRDEVMVGLLGALIGDRVFFNKLGGVDEDFFEEQDGIRAKSPVRYEIADDKKADELLASVLGHFDWQILEYNQKDGTSVGVILGKKEFIEAADKPEEQTEKEAPKAERPKLKEEAFVDEKGMLLYWN